MSALLRLLILSLFVSLAACGGSSSDDDDTSTTSSSTATTTGPGGKGIIIGGTVLAEEITPTGLVTRGTATTGADGKYILDLVGYAGGPVLFTISGNDTAMMTCDVPDGCGTGVAFGDDFALPSSFSMNSISPDLVAGPTSYRPITPFTHLAAQRAIELAGGDAADVTRAIALQALSEVGDLLGGVQVIDIDFIDVTDPEAVDGASPEALANSVLAAAVMASIDSDDPGAAVDGLNAAFNGANDGTIATSIVQDILDEAEEVFDEIGEIDTSTVTDVIQGKIDEADAAAGGSGGVLNPEPSENVGDDDVAKAKALLQETRNVANSVDELEDPSEAFGETIGQAADASADARSSLGDSLAPVLEAVAACYSDYAETDDSNDSLEYDGPTSCPLADSTVGCSGNTVTINITSNSPAGHDTVDADGPFCDETVDLNVVLPREGAESDNAVGNLQAALTGSIRTTTGPGVSLVFAGGGLQIMKVASPAGDEEDLIADVDSVSYEGDATLSQINVDNPVSIAGELELGILRCTSCEGDEPKFNPDNLLIKGTLEDASNSTSITLDWTMLEASARAFDIDVPYSSTNFVEGNLSLTTRLQLTGLPQYLATLALNSTGATDPEGGADDGEPVGNVVASFSRGGYNFTVTAANSSDSPDEDSRKIEITNQDGVEITIDLAETDSDQIGTVKVGEKQVGTVEQTEDGLILIRYIDGTFESLN